MRSRSPRVVTSLLAVMAFASAPACGNDDPKTLLQDADFEALEDSELRFDRNNILDVATLTDFEAFDARSAAEFLAKTPYSRPSFLATYQSNGSRASDAIVRAARTHRINPLVLIVLAETRGGLVGAREYPFPPERVEYVFGCGCKTRTDCLPSLAGFDRQVDCVARRLRTALDQMSPEGGGAELTDSGWGTDKTSTTLDGLKVTPQDPGTAALYDLTPAVREGKDGGNWVFWNVFQRYAEKAQYGGPLGSREGRPVGEPCETDAICAGEGAVCAVGSEFPEGYCTAPCTGICPSQRGGNEAFCAQLKDDTGYCFATCNRSVPDSCRTDYVCARVRRFGSTDTSDGQDVCLPQGLLSP